MSTETETVYVVGRTRRQALDWLRAIPHDGMDVQILGSADAARGMREGMRVILVGEVEKRADWLEMWKNLQTAEADVTTDFELERIRESIEFGPGGLPKASPTMDVAHAPDKTLSERQRDMKGQINLFEQNWDDKVGRDDYGKPGDTESRKLDDVLAEREQEGMEQATGVCLCDHLLEDHKDGVCTVCDCKSFRDRITQEPTVEELEKRIPDA